MIATTGSLLDPVALITPDRTLKTFDRQTIAFLISQGHLLVIHRNLVYRLNHFLAEKHPGGVLPVLHYIGRDATDEIEAYHPVFALAAMKHYVIGKVEVDEEVGWTPLLPPLHTGVGWPGFAEAYESVPALNISLSLKAEYDKVGYPTEGSPPGTKLPFMSVQSLEPPPPPPEICRKEQQRLTQSFRQLRNALLQQDELFTPAPLKVYQNTILRCAGLFSVFLISYLRATTYLHLTVSAASLGFFMHQIMFVAHDAGHTEVTGSLFWDRVIGGTIASYASGMSLGWWSSQHNVHHMVTNHPEHDPDIQLLPFFAFNTRFFDSIYSTFHACTMYFDAPARFLVQYQHLHFYPIMLFARFSLFGKSYHYLATKAKADGWRTFELVGVVFFWTWYTLLMKNIGGHSSIESWAMRVAYTLLVLACVCPIHVQIVLSHSAQDSNDLGVYESFIHRQLRTTMDVSCSENLRWIHGGLEQQVTHHCFPRLPRPNLPYATSQVKAWAKANDVEFLEKSFTKGNSQMVGMLADIAGQWRALKSTADDLARGKIEME